MLILPPQIMTVLKPFSQVFSSRVWDWAQELVIGAILAPGQRTVTSALRVLGKKDCRQFQNYHRVLNRARWSGLAVSRILLRLLVETLLEGDEPLVIGADPTIERRRGQKIRFRGVWRDPVRSTKKYVNYCSGLRWVSMQMLVQPRWSRRVWGLPFLTTLAAKPKTNAEQGRRHKTTIDWIAQMIRAVRRWVPDRSMVLVVDGGLAAVKLGLCCAGLSRPVTLVSRLRLDAVLHEPVGPQPPGKRGVKPKKGARLPSLAARLTRSDTAWRGGQLTWYGGTVVDVVYATDTCVWYTPRHDPLPLRWVLVQDPLGLDDPTAFFCTDLTADPMQILAWYVSRWGVEVTFEEARAHLGFETQRQWSDLAIARTTPAILGLFSLVTLLANNLTDGVPPVQSTAWYQKREATFSDMLACVRFHLWTNLNSVQSAVETRLHQIPPPLQDALLDAICFSR